MPEPRACIADCHKERSTNSETRQKMKGTPSGRPYSRTRRSPEKKVRYTGRQCVTAFGLAACLRSLFSAIAVQVPGALRMLL